MRAEAVYALCTVRPRVHNLVSYSGALLVFGGVLAWRASHGAPLTQNATVGALLWGAHFLRRAIESAFVHRYGKPQIGASDYLTEYLYYWGFAIWIAWSLSAGTHRAPAWGVQALGLVVFAFAEAGNAWSHVMLRHLRPANGRERRIPRGFLFEWVSCPHYLCEILSWLGFNLVTGTLAGLSFMTVGAAILSVWAHARHAAYRQEFSGRGSDGVYPEKRRALLPGVF